MVKNYKENINKVFSNPDIWIACIDLGDDRVYGKIKDRMALLEGIPKPNTGYRFNDIVEVGEPIGKTIYRDDEISVYQAIRIIKSSNLPTFSFEAIVPSSNDWFDLSEVFNRGNTHMRFPYRNNYPVKHWEHGYCIASNIKEAESIFEEFVVSGKDRKVRNIVNAFDDSDIITSEIDGRNFAIELKYSKKFSNSLLILFSIPIILFTAVAIKVGLHSLSEIMGFTVAILFFIGVEIYSYYRLNRETITLNKDGLFATYPIGKQKSMYWENISDVKLSKKKDYVVMKNNNGLKIRISQYHKHFRRFCIIAKNFIKQEVKKEIFEEALKRGTA